MVGCSVLVSSEDMRTLRKDESMTYEEVQECLKVNNQSHILKFWDRLDETARAGLLRQIETLDFDSIGRMQKLLDAHKELRAVSPLTRSPVTHYSQANVIERLTEAERTDALAAGEAKLRAGEVAVLLVAGGQGSRLGYDGPKGAYPIGPVSGKSIFYFHARKIVGLSRRYGVSIPFYIMTSSTNDAATQTHFKENDYFGLNKDDVIFFQQGEWPALDEGGKIILDEPGHIFMCPDGHGGTITALAKNKCFEDMEGRGGGVKTVFYFQVDNPLVEIADPVFIGLHVMRGAKMSLKVCAKRDANENVGVVAMRDGHTEIVEYTDMTDEQKCRKTADGELYFKYGSVAIHVFSLDFLKTEAGREMPIHIAHKKIPMCDEAGKVVKPDKENGYKFEKLIFDVLPNAGNVVNLAFDRADEFSPVKNPVTDKDGNVLDDSPATCQRDMQAKWRRQLRLPDDEPPPDLDPAD